MWWVAYLKYSVESRVVPYDTTHIMKQIHCTMNRNMYFKYCAKLRKTGSLHPSWLFHRLLASMRTIFYRFRTAKYKFFHCFRFTKKKNCNSVLRRALDCFLFFVHKMVNWQEKRGNVGKKISWVNEPS